MNDEGFTWSRLMSMIRMMCNILCMGILIVFLKVFGFPIRIWNKVFGNKELEQ
jgi:hypothetical protein